MLTLSDALTNLTKDEARKFLQALLTPREIRSFEHRWAAVQLVLSGETQRAVGSKLRISVATASRAARAATTNWQMFEKIQKKAKELR